MRDIFAIVANNLLKILIVAIVFGIVAFVLTTRFIATVYQAEATVALKISESADSKKITYSDLLLTQQLVETYSIILKSDEVMQEVKDHLTLPYSIDSLKNKITTTGLKNTQVLKISVQDNDPNKAKNIVNQILLDAPKIINKNFEGASLVAINSAKDGVPIYPSPLINTLISILLGAALVILIEILKEYLDDTIKSDEQIKHMFGISVLGLLPEINLDKQGDSGANGSSYGGAGK
ncbi:MAG: Wzz/FepE/Etk N-terminal domain-containing protein [Clostridia bacterium]